jgi:putative toxin-antitoxin system antitoxin component (TIGR02293 family)
MEEDLNIVNDPAIRYGKAFNGLTKIEFKDIVASTGLNITQFSSLLPVSKRTIEKVKDHELLRADVSDRTLELGALFQHGVEVLGSLQAFQEWLQSPIVSLGAHKPFQFLNRSNGISLINDTLGRIAHGVYS